MVHSMPSMRTSRSNTYGTCTSRATLNSNNKKSTWNFRFADTNQERVQKGQRLNGELDTTPLKYGNKMTFGKVIREVARDRTKDVNDIRDVKTLTFRGSKTHRS